MNLGSTRDVLDFRKAARTIFFGLKSFDDTARAPEKTDDYFALLLNESCADASPDREAIIEASLRRSAGLKAARKRDLQHASVLLEEAREIVHARVKQPSNILLCKSFQIAADAYMAYVMGYFDDARASLKELAEIDLLLEREVRYRLLKLHRVQLLHNVVRIDIRQGLLEDALTLVFALLSCLTERTSTLLEPCTSIESLSKLPIELIKSLAVQICSELCLLVANHVECDHLFLKKARQYLRYPGSVGSPPTQWMELKVLFSDESDEFLERCLSFLELGPQDHRVLWLSTAIDVYKLGHNLDRDVFKLLTLDLSMAAMPPVYYQQLSAVY